MGLMDLVQRVYDMRHKNYPARFRKEVNGEGWDGRAMREFVKSVPEFREVVKASFSDAELKRIIEIKSRINTVRDLEL